MDSSTRSPPPPPLNIRATPSSTATSPDQTMGSYFDSPGELQSQRNFSYSSESPSSPGSPPASSARKTSFGWIKPSPTVNVHTTCGRHSDQMLFGGPSLTELARMVIRKKN